MNYSELLNKISAQMQSATTNKQGRTIKSEPSNEKTYGESTIKNEDVSSLMNAIGLEIKRQGG